LFFNTICVIGLGYIGLPTAAMFASKEKKVIGFDINQHVVDTVNSGKTHIMEPKLELMVKKGVDKGLLRATKSIEPADVFLIAVPTPLLTINSKLSIPEPDLTYIKSAANSVAKVLKKDNLVILESTCPVGVTEKMSLWMSETRPDLTFPHSHGENSDIRISYCPERVLPGNLMVELAENDRIIGGVTNKCSQRSIELYKEFVKGEFFITNPRTAEMCKLTENSSRDVQIAFANELSIICDKLDIDVWELISLANRHPRVDILKPGPGVGGHCIAVDPWFIVSSATKDSKLIKTARSVNNSKPSWVLKKLKLKIADFFNEYPEKKPKDLIIACYGLTFKADIDDLRESPSLEIASKVTKLNPGQTFVVEPNILDLPNSLKDLELIKFETAIKRADINLILVDHTSFKKQKVWGKYTIDTRGITHS